MAPVGLTPDAGFGQGVFAVDRDLGSGYVQQWNASLQRELTRDISIEVAYTGSKITHVGIPDTNLNQLTVDQLAQGAPLLQRCRIRTSASSRDHPPWAIRRSQGRSCSSRIRNTPRSASTGTTSGPRSIRRLREAGTAVLRGFSYLVSYTRSKLEDDASSVFDASILTGPIANYPVADSFNRTLERDYSTGDMPHVFVSSAVWDIPFGANRRTSRGASSARSSATGR